MVFSQYLMHMLAMCLPCIFLPHLPFDGENYKDKHCPLISNMCEDKEADLWCLEAIGKHKHERLIIPLSSHPLNFLPPFSTTTISVDIVRIYNRGRYRDSTEAKLQIS